MIALRQLEVDREIAPELPMSEPSHEIAALTTSPNTDPSISLDNL
jgi:hypothetical protein